ncbi:S8 family serine peptidase [Macellibacteroides fermentans]|uniref:S8 family serine peptidase n=1 Tax=Macellibacteroides fermentans TaxID=879969 RepID=UPI00406C31CB
MKEKAIAKSHKPTALFKPKTCPIVGTEKLDELLIKVTPDGLMRLMMAINQADSVDAKINMTKIKEIKEYSLSEKIDIQNFESITSFTEPIKVKLFSFDDAIDNKYFASGFEAHVKQLGIETIRLDYGKNLCVYKLYCENKENLEKILVYPGVHKISFFPQYTCEFPHIEQAKRKTPELPMPVSTEDYPIIGIIDSGIIPKHAFLEPWIYGREIFVPEEYINYEHGTFVAGIIEYGNILNFNAPQQHYKILDVVVSPNNDSQKGPTDSLSEDRLISILRDVISRYHNEVKVWNMSLGTDTLCKDTISDLAIALDEIQDLYDVDIILAAGNYIIPPLRQWPPIDDLKEQDRITSPADSVRAITVGSIASVGIADYVDKDMPSPFTRRGPGANFLIKPDLVHYGGNCMSNLCCSGTGVVSFDTNGNIVEGIGTSYSAPAVTSIYAGLRHGIIEERSREFAKAFLIHSANIPEKAKKDSKDYDKYYGYGLPKQNIEDILTCSRSDVTLVFSGELLEGTFIEFNDFPYPKSLFKEGKCYGKIKMTLVYTPKLDASFGQEYCRANIDAHLGTYDYIDEEGHAKGFSGEVPLEKKWNQKYEKAQVENGFKWNPIKSYSRSIKNGITEKHWRLLIDSVARLGDNYEGQEFALFITISDPKKRDIYTEVINALRERGYYHNNVKIHNKIRQSLGFN